MMNKTEQNEFLDVYEQFIAERQQRLVQFLRENRENAEKLRAFLKKAYDLIQDVNPSSELRDVLYVSPDFDDEQVWQQIEMYNESSTVSLLKRLKELIAQTNEVQSYESLWCKEIIQPESNNQREKATVEELPEAVSDESDVLSEQSLGDDSADADEDEIDNALQRELERLSKDAPSAEDGEELNEETENESEEEAEDEEGESDSANRSDHEQEETAMNMDDQDADVEEDENGEVDDTFFKLSEMEAFADGLDKAADDADADDDADESASGEEDPVYYAQFFDPPRNNGNTKMQERFLNERFDGKGESESNTKSGSKKLEKSMRSAQKRVEAARDATADPQKRERKRDTSNADKDSTLDHIRQAEEERVAPKSWQLLGEVSARDRPLNALLGETLEFDYGATTRPEADAEREANGDGPNAAGDVIERMIKERIRGLVFDDVVRKSKPTDPKFELRKDVLDTELQEKSKESLAAVYERDFLERVNAQRVAAAEENAGGLTGGDTDGTDALLAAGGDETLAKLRGEVRELLTSVCLKLDALTNTHFNPRFYNKSDEVQVLAKSKENKSVAALALEDVAPVSTSDVQLLRPEEVSARAHAKSQEELTTGEKRTLRKRAKRRRAISAPKRTTGARGKPDESDQSKNTPNKEKNTKRKAGKRVEREASGKTERTASKLRTSSRFFDALQKDVAAKKADKRTARARLGEASGRDEKKRSAKQLKL